VLFISSSSSFSVSRFLFLFYLLISLLQFLPYFLLCPVYLLLSFFLISSLSSVVAEPAQVMAADWNGGGDAA
jgi:hypothetical protein